MSTSLIQTVNLPHNPNLNLKAQIALIMAMAQTWSTEVCRLVMVVMVVVVLKPTTERKKANPQETSKPVVMKTMKMTT